MPKFITPTALAAIQQRTPVSSCVIVSVLWGYDLQWYSSKAVVIPGIDAQPRVMEVGNMSSERRADNRSTTGDISVTLDDSDGRLKFYVDNTVAEKTDAQIWLWFDGTGFNDRMLLISGHMKDPEWHDENRQVTFTVETVIEKQEFGFSPTRDDFKDLSDDAVGVAWPAAFGIVRHLPTVRAKKRIQAILISDIRLMGKGYYESSGSQEIEDIQPHIQSFINDVYEDDIILVDQPSLFPQKKSIVLAIDNVYFQGQFQEDGRFIVEQAHYPKYQNIEITCVGQPNTTTTGKDIYFGKVATLSDPSISLANTFCYFADGSFDYCERQVGLNCYFSYALLNGKGFPRQETDTIKFVYAVAENGMIAATKDIERDFHLFSANQLGFSIGIKAKFDLWEGLSQSPTAFWRRETGTVVYQWDIAQPDIYIASAIKMSSIDLIYGKKAVHVNGKQRKIFTEIPDDYFEIQLQSDIPVNKQFVSGLIVPTPLSELIGQEWDDEIFISGTSTEGPNSVEIIRYILEQFTDLDLDGSFDNISGDLAPYPCNFAYFDRKNALQLAQEIAWQSRCVLVVDAEKVSIRYLGQAPDAIMLFNESNVDQDSVRLSWTSIDEIVTRFDATWTDTYKDSPSVQNLNTSEVNRLSRVLRTLVKDTYKERTATKLYQYRENIDVFGLTNEQVNIFIYTDEASVKRTSDFWGHRKANSWQKIVFRALNLDALILQPFDGIAIALSQSPILLNVIGTVERVEYDHSSRKIEIQAWLPVIAGTQTVDSKAYG